MTDTPDSGAHGQTVATLYSALTEALDAGTPAAFTALLTDDVRWGGERRGGGHECTNREQAGEHYAGLLDAGVALSVADLTSTDQPNPANPGNPGNLGSGEGTGAVFTARMRVQSPDPEDFPAEMAVRLTLRDGLIAEICILDPPPTIEVLYFDGCPHVEQFLPHLHDLLAEHGVTAPVTLIRVDDEQDAQAHRFLGSPTVRVNGRDVDPTIEHNHDETEAAAGRFRMQCRLYATPEGPSTGSPPDQWVLDALIDNPVHEAAITAIRGGDVPALQQLLEQHPGLASARLARHEGRTPLHIATDWPGHHPNVAATIAAIVAAGADPNTGCLGEHPETPLHWAASSNDLDAIDALLDAGANINAPGAVIAGGTPMADATAFGQWDAARRLLDRGADTNLFEAATLGLVAEVQRHLEVNHPTAETITSSLWGACHGGHIDTAAVLLEHGADINWVGYDELTPLDAAHRAEAPAVVAWLEQRGATSTAQPTSPGPTKA